MVDKRKGYSPEVARKAIVFLTLGGVGMTKEEVFEAERVRGGTEKKEEKI